MMLDLSTEFLLLLMLAAILFMVVVSLAVFIIDRLGLLVKWVANRLTKSRQPQTFWHGPTPSEHPNCRCMPMYVLARETPPDPAKNCRVYKENGCPHMGGTDCNMDTCNILDQYTQEQMSKPKPKCSGCGDRGLVDMPPWGIVQCEECINR